MTVCRGFTTKSFDRSINHQSSSPMLNELFLFYIFIVTSIPQYKGIQPSQLLFISKNLFVYEKQISIIITNEVSFDGYSTCLINHVLCENVLTFEQVSP